MSNTNKIINQYINAAIEYGEAQEKGAAEKVNKNADIIRNLRQEIREDSEMNLQVLEPLLDHENDYVRLKAAYDLLPFCTSKVEQVLEELSKKKKLIGFEAEMLLEVWRKGEL